MSDTDLATRYVEALITKLEQTADPMMTAVLTAKIEERIGPPAFRPAQKPEPAQVTTSPAPPVNLNGHHDNIPAAPANTPPAHDNAVPPSDNGRVQKPGVKPYAGQLPRGAMQDWLKSQLTGKSNSVYALAQLALKEGLWPVEIPRSTAISRIDAVLRSYEGDRFKKVKQPGDSRIHWTAI